MAGQTYVPLQTSTLGSATSTVTLNAFSSAYTDLYLVVNGQTSGNCSAWLRFNGDTATNYSSTGMFGNGTNATAYRRTSETAALLTYNGATGTNPSQWNISIMNYNNSTTYKTALNRFNCANSETLTNAILWRATPAAITSITMYLDAAANFGIGTTFTLYGILAA